MYRDRAKERRQGVATADFAEVPNLPAPTPSRGVFSSLSSDVDGVLGGSSVRMDQYLGGDMEHTHLVKGLDYALLQKVRLEQQQKQQQQQQQQPEDASGPPSAMAADKAMAPSAAVPAAAALQAHTPLGRAVLSFLQRDSQRPSATAQAARAARFARHATTLAFNVDVRALPPCWTCAPVSDARGVPLPCRRMRQQTSCRPLCSAATLLSSPRLRTCTTAGATPPSCRRWSPR